MKFQRSSAFLQAGRDAERGLRYFRGLAAICGESSSYSRDSETAANKRREMMKHEHLDAGPTEEQFQNMLQKAVLRHYPNPVRKGCLDSETIATSGVMLLKSR
jgi:hypothetical protein